MFDGEQGAGGAESTETRTDTTAKNATSGEQGDGSSDGKVTFSKEQQDEIGRLLSKERKAAADKARADAKAEADAAAEQARKDKEAEDAKKAGDFEKVESTLKADLDAARTEATSLKGENDQLREAMKAGVDAQWKDLPPALQLAGKVIAEDDVLGRWNFLNDPDVVKQVKDAEANAGPKAPHNRDPKANGTSNATNEDARKAQASLYRNF